MADGKRFFLLILMIGCIVVAPVSAITEQETEDFFMNTYNPQVAKMTADIPLIKSVFATQIIHIIIKDQNKNIEMAATTNADGYITDFKNGAPLKPTLRLISNTNTIEKIKASSDPALEVKNAFINGDITYEGVGIREIIVVSIIKIVQFFSKIFGLI